MDRRGLDKLFKSAVKEAAQEFIDRDRKITLDALMRIQTTVEMAISRLNGEKRTKAAHPAKPSVSVTTAVPMNGNGNHSASTVLQKVYRYVFEQGAAQDAKSVVAGTGVPEPSVRWAFVKLTESGSLKRESRGRYVIGTPVEEDTMESLE